MSAEIETQAAETLADQTGTPTLSQVLEETVRAAHEDLHAIAPGIVDSVSMSAGTCDVHPAVSRPDAEDEPSVPGVPLLRLGNAAAYVQVPVAAGNGVLLAYADRSLDEWQASGGARRVDADDPRTHDPSDAVALPFALGGADAGADAAVVVKGDDVRLGTSGAVDGLIKGQSLQAAVLALGLPTSSCAAPGSPDAPLLAWCISLWNLLQSLPLSTKVKVS